MTDEIRSIAIVGGGTAGWMTAAYLNRHLAAERISITLVESPEIETVGVGEATVPPLVHFLEVLGIDLDDFIVRCDASYKLGIEFVDWHRPGTAFWHPFGPIGGAIDGIDVFHHWLARSRAGEDDSPYGSYSLQAQLAQACRAPRSLHETTVVTEKKSYAFHLDAAAFARVLRTLAVERGVRHLRDEVQRVVLDERGRIERLETAAHGALAADLFIDCTGFRGLLVEEALGDPWVDESSRLLCDTAFTLSRPPAREMRPQTRAIAREAGWVWRIPLQSREGLGYVHSSAFIDAEAAERSLRALAGDEAGRSQLRRLSMRVGRRSHFQVGNCVAVGLSAGFLEPLESTGLYLIQKSLELLLAHWPDRHFEPRLVDRYDEQVERVYAEARDFVLLHYLWNGRSDGFWRASREVAVPDSLRQTLELYRATGLVGWEQHALFGDTSFHALAAGFERFPERPLPALVRSDAASIPGILAQIKQQNQWLIARLPEHAELLAALRGT